VTDRIEIFRREAERCLEASRRTHDLALRAELVAMATKYLELAKVTTQVRRDTTIVYGGTNKSQDAPTVQQQQQPQPDKKAR